MQNSASKDHSRRVPPQIRTQGDDFSEHSSLVNNKVFLKDYDIEQNEHFVKYVFIPYFKDIFKDLAERSDKKAKGINHIAFIEYVNLPGILSERFFKIMDENNDEYIDQKEFMKAMFKVYYSQLETKFKLVFDMYDFDQDGEISKEDIHLVMSHIPISHNNQSSTQEEGSFTKDGGGLDQFQHRVESQKQIRLFLEDIFKAAGKDKINIDDFIKLNQSISSEMFLSIMILFHEKLPCSENFFRYFKNYDKYMEDKVKAGTAGEEQMQDVGDQPNMISQLAKSPVRQIESPKYGLGLSVIDKFMTQHSPLGSPQALSPTGQKMVFNIDTKSQQLMLQNAATNLKENLQMQVDEQQEGYDQFLDHSSPKTIIQNIPIQQFKQNHIQMIDGKLSKQEEEKKAASREPTSPLLFSDALRLPNVSLQKSINRHNPLDDGYASPTNILNSNSQVYDNLKLTSNDEQFIQYEGELFRKAAEGKLKRYWYCLLGKEFYCYKKKDDERHKDMHSLVGVFIKSDKEEQLDNSTALIYPFKIIFPMNKVRVYYCRNRDERSKWLHHLKQAMGYSQIEDFYEIQEDLGKGKFGQVKLAKHIKTGNKVAIKVIKKKHMSLKELELQKREIEVLKICQHPNIIRLIDVFENPDYIYIVLEHCSGGDLFQYLDKRDFKITEDRARQIVHQLAASLYYLHSYGIAHRDLKLENILMVNQSDDSPLKLVDFGLSKMIGPSETSTDPFGTLSYVAPEVLIQRPYGKNVDLWSLGVIQYVLLSGMLPFDSEDNKETARQTIYDPVPFDHQVWKYVSDESKDLILRLLEKDRFKRISLEEVLAHPWICKRSKDIQEIRMNVDLIEQFEAFSTTDYKSPKNKP